MADILARLKEAINGKAPQHKVEGKAEFEFTEGKDGKLNVRDVDVKAELELIKQQQQQILDRLNQPVKTELTGSIVEELTLVNALAITDTDTRVTSNIDLGKYKKFDFIIENTHNEDLRIGFSREESTSPYRVALNDGTIKLYAPFNNEAFHLVPANSGLILLSNVPIPNAQRPLAYKDFINIVKVRYNFVNAPTSGALTIKLVGRV